jgi:xanthine dehydrogenase accessory factor
MFDVMADIDRWLSQKEPIALATVIQTWGSSPRRVGAKMAMTPGGQIAGSVSGGCVEGAVYEAGMETLASGRPQLLHFGVADETAWEVGLACGGSIDVFVEPLDAAAYELIREVLLKKEQAAVVTAIGGPAHLLGRQWIVGDGEFRFGRRGSEVEGRVLAAAERALVEGKSQRLDRTAAGGAPGVALAEAEPVELFVEVTPRPPTLIMVGGVHIAIALAAIARTLGYRTVVVDPRRAFGSEERFPEVDELIAAWPDEAFGRLKLTTDTAVAMLTHDPKIDDPALKHVLNSPVFYVGALGSQKTQEKRRQRLLKAGLSPEQVARIHGPIGLPIGAQTPEEIALSVMAEIVKVRRSTDFTD